MSSRNSPRVSLVRGMELVPLANAPLSDPEVAWSANVQRGTTRILLDPVARFVPRADGVVDLYLMPAYDDIASLYLVKGQWRVHCTACIPTQEQWPGGPIPSR